MKFLNYKIEHNYILCNFKLICIFNNLIQLIKIDTNAQNQSKKPNY